MKSKPYNGYPNWNQWNVSLWLNSDYDLYLTMLECYREAKGNATRAARRLKALLPERTPDGARYSLVAIRGAMTDLED